MMKSPKLLSDLQNGAHPDYADIVKNRYDGLKKYMKNELVIKNGIVIPEHELEITTSRSGGPGGQHVNKTETRVSVRWNIKKTIALSDEQKARVIQNLRSRLTEDGELIIHNSSSRSQQHNKKLALEQLVKEIRKALHVPKKRMKTRVPKSIQESRLQTKKRRSALKKLRREKP